MEHLFAFQIISAATETPSFYDRTFQVTTSSLGLDVVSYQFPLGAVALGRRRVEKPGLPRPNRHRHVGTSEYRNVPQPGLRGMGKNGSKLPRQTKFNADFQKSDLEKQKPFANYFDPRRTVALD